jgi:hypothetical protein
LVEFFNLNKPYTKNINNLEIKKKVVDNKKISSNISKKNMIDKKKSNIDVRNFNNKNKKENIKQIKNEKTKSLSEVKKKKLLKYLDFLETEMPKTMDSKYEKRTIELKGNIRRYIKNYLLEEAILQRIKKLKIGIRK